MTVVAVAWSTVAGFPMKAFVSCRRGDGNGKLVGLTGFALPQLAQPSLRTR